MGKRPSCRSCFHCTPQTAAVLGWCKLRHLAIHPELSGEVWCHHWTALPPRLPATGPDAAGKAPEPWPLTEANGQLALTPLLVES
ncbi:hypothetical protein [Cyanobium sp. Morenito 9A2]|uniref:hypothetical protein n=1 Tax=Cyanobium sp. Morenito 9A2 TaxID=2823718 RepID=UPI0020CFA1E7|nr:hypothetical protein [Cyanobium sp. Morenito 9A2]MCP9850452.1 hypothetical protein [Cyanobium sp. Morenito 9A2]